MTADTSARPLEHPLLTVDDAARLLAVRKSWLLDAAQAGRIPVVRLGGRVLRFRRDDLDAFVEAATRRPSPDPTPTHRRTPRTRLSPVPTETPVAPDELAAIAARLSRPARRRKT